MGENMSNANASTPDPPQSGLDWSHMNTPPVPGAAPAEPEIILPPKPDPPRYAPPQGAEGFPAGPAAAPQSAPATPPYAAGAAAGSPSTPVPPYGASAVSPYPGAQYPGQGYAAPYTAYAAPVAPPRPGRAISLTAGWLAIAGAALALIPFVGLLTWLLPLAAVIVGIVALARRAEGRGWAITGVVLGVLGMLVLPFVSLIIVGFGYGWYY